MIKVLAFTPKHDKNFELYSKTCSKFNTNMSYTNIRTNPPSESIEF
jgi:hypothetical protein